MKPSAIAIVGMAGRFPGARTISEFWENLRTGVESIRDCTDDQLLAAGASADELADPAYVKRASILQDVPLFDASFFGLSPRDASIMDPQHRHFLECAWEVLEDAGHAPKSFDASIGIFAGSGLNTYLIHNLLANRRLLETAGLFQLKQTGNDKDVLATRVSYQFDLHGPSINVQTACSTSLVAVHLACQSLLNYECDMALAGGVTIEIPHGVGYIYREGEILSRDGRCRAFDANSSGTVFGSGVGIVALRRLEDALSSSDQIHAVILGSAINNDGARKVGYLAPSVEGQAEVIEEALAFAGISAADVSYVETHGTGTAIGDPIEVRALTQAFRKSTDRTGYCGIGSVKTNVGHLDAASGVAGLIKTVLALKHSQLPPTLHFKQINPHVDIKNSPFFVTDTLAEWEANGSTRHAGVTSLGIGGTNAHVVLEEAPRPSLVRAQRSCELLIVSAKTETAADRAFKNLLAHVQSHPGQNLADVAFTCQLGRQHFPHRRALVVENDRESLQSLSESTKPHAAGVVSGTSPAVAFMFSGQGSQYINMGRRLYETEAVYRDTLNSCAERLKADLGTDLIQELFPPDDQKEAATERLNQTWLTQPALFSVEYALARWYVSLGVQPSAMVGHSIGEYVAACLAGVFTLEDALAIVALRGRLIYSLPPGAMLAVPLPPDQLKLEPSVSIAAINSPGMSVISGSPEAISALERDLTAKGTACTRLHTSHAFHSGMMDPILDEFGAQLRRLALHVPQLPYVSNVTGTWVEPQDATNPAYWSRHIRQTVRFSDCIQALLRDPNRMLIEVGPGNVLTSLARQQGVAPARALQTLPHPRESISDLHCAFQTIGRLWVAGVEIDWQKARPAGSAQRVSLPTYPFEHKKFWIEPDRVQPKMRNEPAPESNSDKGPRVYQRVWKPAPIPVSPPSPATWIIFRDTQELGEELASLLQNINQNAILVDPGSSYRRSRDGRYIVRPGVREDYDALLNDVTRSGESAVRILHLWPMVSADQALPIEQSLDLCFYSPLYLAQTLAAKGISNPDILLVSNRMQELGDISAAAPAQALLLGPARVISQEIPEISCRAVDLDFSGIAVKQCVSQLINEAMSMPVNTAVAYRGSSRFVEDFEPFLLPEATERRRLEREGVYLITGALGGIGLVLAEHLARSFRAGLILVHRSDLPHEKDWETALDSAQVRSDQKKIIRKLIEIRSLASRLLVARADVTDLDQMRAAVAYATKRFGRIDGVFHAAGVLDDGPLMLKSKSGTSRVIEPKVKGTLVLEEILRDRPLKCFVLFSSISSVLPPPGQTDYAAANAFLNAFALSRKGAVTAIDWDAWQEVGMAARAGSPHPLLRQRLLTTPLDRVFASNFSIDSQWVLSEHRLKSGEALLPGTAYLEMVAAAFAANTGHEAFEIQDVHFLAPFSVSQTESRELRVELRREENAGAKTGASTFSVFGRDGQWIEHASGSIRSCSQHPASHPSISTIADRCTQREIEFDEQHRTRQEHYFNFGPRWRCLKWLRIGDREGLARLEMDAAFEPDFTQYRTHPALFDMATGCSLYLIDGYESTDDLYLPFSYKMIRVYKPFPPKLLSHIRPRSDNRSRGEIQTFDLTLYNEQGECLAEIEGFAMRRIGDHANSLLPAQPMRDFARFSGKEPIAVESRSWIAPSEGLNVLTQILSAVTPSELIVSAAPLERPAEPVMNVAKPAKSDPEANEDIEATIKLWFEELLGVETVGLDDDFFALGGHSLIGVRLFAKIKKTYQVDLELAALFQARTVRQLTERIRKDRRPAVFAPEDRSCIVPIQTHGSQTPLFLIHAIGGEVLFYEPLAKALGPDQPVYALQSMLAGMERPRDTTITELAACYVREIRSLFPSGPYLLGGLSYGGILAFEMAQQLHEQGMQPALLVVIDAVVPGSKEHMPRSAQQSFLMSRLREKGVHYLVAKAALKWEYMSQKCLHHARLIAASGYSRLNRSFPLQVRFAMMEESHRRAMESYDFRPYAGKICLIRATERGYNGVESISERDHPTLGWGNLAMGGLEIHDVVADHSNILLNPNVAAVAEEIKKMLSTADTRSVHEMPVA